MDVCAASPPPHDLDADDPAAELAFYRAGLKHFSQIALRLADRTEQAPELSLPEQAETVERLAQSFRRNARMARHLREPLPTTPPPATATTRRADPPRDLSKVPDAELAAILHRERLEALDRLEPLEPTGDDLRALINPACRDLGHCLRATIACGPESQAPGHLDPICRDLGHCARSAFAACGPADEPPEPLPAACSQQPEPAGRHHPANRQPATDPDTS